MRKCRYSTHAGILAQQVSDLARLSVHGGGGIFDASVSWLNGRVNGRGLSLRKVKVIRGWLVSQLSGNNRWQVSHSSEAQASKLRENDSSTGIRAGRFSAPRSRGNGRHVRIMAQEVLEPAVLLPRQGAGAKDALGSQLNRLREGVQVPLTRGYHSSAGIRAGRFATPRWRRPERGVGIIAQQVLRLAALSP